MRTWLIASGLLGLLSCSRAPTLLVTVANLPAKAQSLQVIATHGGVSTTTDIDPFNLPQPPGPATTLLLRLPANFSGDVGVSVGAFDQPDAKGCLVGSGANTDTMFMSPDDNLTVSLDAVTDTTCSGKRPQLLAATPGIGQTAGNETITLQGWGFKPDSTVTMGTKSATFSFLSAAKLQVTTPAHAGFGLTPIRIANKDGSFDLRKDLFRFYSNTLSFTAYPVNNSVPFLDTSGFAVGLFDPTTTTDLALALPTTPTGVVRMEFTLGGQVVNAKQKDYSVGKNPGPLVSADFDKDGDLDVIVANIDDGTIQMLKNDGTGLFVVGSPQGVGQNPVAMATGDLNGDGSPDLVVTNKLTGMAGYVRIYLNSGDGTLTEIQNSPIKVGQNPGSVAIGDITGDHQPEVVVSAQADNKVYLLLNQGAGKFVDSGATLLSLPVCNGPTSVQVYDTDNNGQTDVLVSCSTDNLIRVVLNMGYPNIATYDLTTEATPRNMTLTDLNGDGISDIIVPCQGANRINIFLNKQGAGFQGVTAISKDVLCNQPYLTAILDIDSDGKADVGVAGLGNTNGCLSILFNQTQ